MFYRWCFFSCLSPQTGLPVRGSYSFERGACSGRMIWRLLFSHKRHSGFSECFGSAWFRACLPLASCYTLDSLPAWFQACLPLASTCLPVHPGYSECFRTCPPRVSYYTLNSPWLHISLPLVSTCRRLSPSALCKFWALWSAWFRTCLRMSSGFFPTCFPVHSGCYFALDSHSCLPLHSQFSARMISHLSPTCLPVRSGWSQCSASHDFKLVSDLCTLVSPFSQRHGSLCIVCGTTTTNHFQPTTTFNLCCLRPQIPWN